MYENAHRYSPFGVTLKKKLIDIGKSQKWLSKQVGMAEACISRLITGERDDPEKIEKINAFLRTIS